MTRFMYLAIVAAAIFPYTMTNAIKKVVNKENSTAYTILSCVCNTVIIATLVLLNS